MQDILLIQQYIHTRQSISNQQYTSEKRTYKIYKHDVGNTYIQDESIIPQDIHTRHTLIIFAIHTRKTYIQDVHS